MFRIKICGITQSEDARHAVRLGADAIGLNFFAGSKRHVPLDKATEIVEMVRATSGGQNLPPVTVVGVFVNAAADEIRDLVQRVPLDAIQLHGDEPKNFPADLQPIDCLRALRVRSLDDPRIKEIQEEVEAGFIRGVLVDAYHADAYGGTGQTVAWDWIPQLQTRWPELPTILAGGLTPDNVTEAIQTATPTGVDVASGVEDAPGVKSLDKLERFIPAARQVLGLEAVT